MTLGGRMGGGGYRATFQGVSVRAMSPTCTTLVHMTVRLSVSLPDDLHADLVRVGAASNISASAVVRAVLSDLLPRMTGILDYLASVPPSEVAPMAGAIDAWAADLRTVLHDAPDPLAGWRGVLDELPPVGDEP